MCNNLQLTFSIDKMKISVLTVLKKKHGRERNWTEFIPPVSFTRQLVK